MEAVQVKQLSPGDRFALRDWMDKPQNRVVYRIPERPSDSVVAKRIRNDLWVYKLSRVNQI